MKKTDETTDFEQLFAQKSKHHRDVNEIRRELLLKPEIVPSAAMREFWEKEPWGFRDEEIAAIICNSYAPYGVKFEALTKVGTITDDMELRKSIGRCLYREMDLQIRHRSDDYGHAFKGENFANAFVNMNTPFHKGDIVMSTKDKSRHGILMNGGWIQPTDGHTVNEYGNLDYGDVQFRVEWLDERGIFYHEHVNPLNLDYYVPKKDEPDYNVLMNGAYLVNGSDCASLQCFQMACEEMARNIKSSSRKSNVDENRCEEE